MDLRCYLACRLRSICRRFWFFFFAVRLYHLRWLMSLTSKPLRALLAEFPVGKLSKDSSSSFVFYPQGDIVMEAASKILTLEYLFQTRFYREPNFTSNCLIYNSLISSSWLVIHIKERNSDSLCKFHKLSWKKCTNINKTVSQPNGETSLFVNREGDKRQAKNFSEYHSFMEYLYYC